MSPTNLPVQWTSFIGRKQELSDLEGLLATSRLVTLTGVGGCGKTRLALQVASARERYYPDGVWLANLTSTRDPALIPQTIIQAFGLHLAADQPVLEQFLELIKPKHMLLVLDNCEHLVEACAQLIRIILSHSSGLHILTTSRQPLSLPGEVVYPLAGLQVPPPEITFENPQQAILRYSSLQLYLDRVRAIQPGFNITSENISAIAEICQRLDGLPLALELASARSNMLTQQQVRDRLSDRFKFLVSKQRSSEENHHQTLSATIDWSYDLLSRPEQILFRRLSVFAPGFTLTTVETICAGDEVDCAQVLDLLSSLANQSLLVSYTLNRSQARYSMLETIRQYAQAKLIASGEWEMMHDRHLHCFLKIAEECETNLTGPYQRIWLDWLEEFNENIRVALSWAIEPAGERSEARNRRVEAGLRIAIAIYQFWAIRDYGEEGLNWYEQLLAQAGEGVPVHIRANAFAYASFLAGFRRRETDQMRYGNSAAALANQAGEQGKAALKWALYAQYYAVRAAGDHQVEYDLGLRLIDLNREQGDRYQLALMLSFTAFSAMTIGAYDAAQGMITEALAMLREAGNPYRIAMALNYAGDLARCQKDFKRAKANYQESMALLRELDAPRDLASSLQNQGHAYLHLGEIKLANQHFEECLVLQLGQKNTPGIAECFIGFASLAVACGFPVGAARLLASAETIGGPRITSTWAATRLEFENATARVKAKLTEAELQAEYAAGSAMSLDQAVSYAKSLSQKALTLRKSQKTPDQLSVREREVAEWIAQGMSNADIADRMVVSKRTIEKHIAHILEKLSLENRAQIVRWVFEYRQRET